MIHKEYTQYFYEWYVNKKDAPKIFNLGDFFAFPDGHLITVGSLLSEIMNNPTDYPLGEQ